MTPVLLPRQRAYCGEKAGSTVRGPSKDLRSSRRIWGGMSTRRSTVRAYSSAAPPHHLTFRLVYSSYQNLIPCTNTCTPTWLPLLLHSSSAARLASSMIVITQETRDTRRAHHEVPSFAGTRQTRGPRCERGDSRHWCRAGPWPV